MQRVREGSGRATVSKRLSSVNGNFWTVQPPLSAQLHMGIVLLPRAWLFLTNNEVIVYNTADTLEALPPKA